MICTFPDCKSEGAHTWALVLLCTAHHEAISDETDRSIPTEIVDPK
jgi:hypothetical protein